MNEKGVDAPSLNALIESGAIPRPLILVPNIVPDKTGRAIIRDLGLDEMVDRNSRKILTYLKANLDTQNPVKIQLYCIETARFDLDKFISKDDINKIIQYASNNGRWPIYYMILVGLLARDLYFVENSTWICTIPDEPYI